MLTLFLPPILGLVLQGIIFRRKDRQVQRKPYTLGRSAYAACLFGLWFQIAVTLGLAGWVEGILFQKQIVWMIWGMWCVALMPTMARRLQHLGWPAWPALLFGLPIIPEPGFAYLIVPLLGCALLLAFATTRRHASAGTAWSATFQQPDVPATGRGGPLQFSSFSPSGGKSGPPPPPLPVPSPHPSSASAAAAPSSAGPSRLDLITRSSFTENGSNGDSGGGASIHAPGAFLSQGGAAEPDLRRQRPIDGLGLITCAQGEGDTPQTIGPYELPIILHLWDSGHLRPDALYWHAQLPHWQPLAPDVESLRKKVRTMEKA